MLIDSNILIYAAHPAYPELRNLIRTHAPAVSIVSYIEVLGFPRLQEKERLMLEAFFQAARVIPLSNDIARQAIALRQERRMSLGDSIIAATGIVHDLTLVTHDISDFQWVPGLTLLDPLADGP